jgi:tripartite-type tricarboxylate transporter receptor subunit TctC
MFGRRGFTLGSAAGLGALGGFAARRAAAQNTPWPDRPLRWLVGYPPGGPSDTFARMTGAHIGARLGQSVVVENRPGGGAVLASDAVARSAPDGYTMLHVDNGILVYNAALYSRLPFDPDRDLQGVGFIGRFPLFIVVRPDSPARDFADFVARSRAQAPNYGSPAVASPHHLAMEMVKRRSGLQANHVPYRGGPAAMQDLLAGQLDAVMIDLRHRNPVHLRRPRPRAVRAERGAEPARAGGSDAARARRGRGGGLRLAGHERAGGRARAGAGAAGRGAARGGGGGGRAGALRHPRVESAPWSPAEFNDFVRRENAAWRPLIRELGIKLDS